MSNSSTSARSSTPAIAARINAYVNILAALVAYTWQEHKPSLHLTYEERDLLLNAAM